MEILVTESKSDKFIESCRLCLTDEQDVDLLSDYKPNIKLCQILSTLLNIDVNND